MRKDNLHIIFNSLVHRVVFFMVFSCVILMHSCLDDISLDGQENNLESIMIRGKLTLGAPSKIRVDISKLSNFTKYKEPEAIEGATAFLKSDAGEQIQLTELGNGIYVSEVDENSTRIRIESGGNYQIELDMPGLGKYESELEPMIGVPAIENLEIDLIEKQFLDKLENVETKAFVRILVDTEFGFAENEQKPFLKWEFESAYRFPEATIETEPLRPFNLCYYFDDLNLNDVAIFDGNSSSSEKLERHVVLEELIDHRFYRGLYVNVIQQSISQAAFDYWRQVKELINRDGGFFESTPGRITSNIKSLDRADELVFGYFYTSAEDSLRIYIDQGDVGLPSPYCKLVANIEEFTSLDDECRSCLIREGSTIVKPDFWVD